MIPAFPDMKALSAADGKTLPTALTKDAPGQAEGRAIAGRLPAFGDLVERAATGARRKSDDDTAPPAPRGERSMAPRSSIPWQALPGTVAPGGPTPFAPDATDTPNAPRTESPERAAPSATGLSVAETSPDTAGREAPVSMDAIGERAPENDPIPAPAPQPARPVPAQDPAPWPSLSTEERTGEGRATEAPATDGPAAEGRRAAILPAHAAPLDGPVIDGPPVERPAAPSALAPAPPPDPRARPATVRSDAVPESAEPRVRTDPRSLAEPADGPRAAASGAAAAPVSTPPGETPAPPLDEPAPRAATASEDARAAVVPASAREAAIPQGEGRAIPAVGPDAPKDPVRAASLQGEPGRTAVDAPREGRQPVPVPVDGVADDGAAPAPRPSTDAPARARPVPDDAPVHQAKRPAEAPATDSDRRTTAPAAEHAASDVRIARPAVPAPSTAMADVPSPAAASPVAPSPAPSAGTAGTAMRPPVAVPVIGDGPVRLRDVTPATAGNPVRIREVAPGDAAMAPRPAPASADRFAARQAAPRDGTPAPRVEAGEADPYSIAATMNDPVSVDEAARTLAASAPAPAATTVSQGTAFTTATPAQTSAMALAVPVAALLGEASSKTAPGGIGEVAGDPQAGLVSRGGEGVADPRPAASPARPVTTDGADALQEIVRAAVVTKGPTTIELRLDPSELGKIDIELSFVDDRVSVMVRGEREDALDLMRRSSDELGRMLRQAGLDLDTLGFGRDQAGDRDRERAFKTLSVEMAGEGAGDAVDASSPTLRPGAMRDRVDIRI